MTNSTITADELRPLDRILVGKGSVAIITEVYIEKGIVTFCQRIGEGGATTERCVLASIRLIRVDADPIVRPAIPVGASIRAMRHATPNSPVIGYDIYDEAGKLVCVLPAHFVFPAPRPAVKLESYGDSKVWYEDGVKHSSISNPIKLALLNALAAGPLTIEALTMAVRGHIAVPLAELVNTDRLVSVSCGIYTRVAP